MQEPSMNNRRIWKDESGKELLPVSEERVTGPLGLSSVTHTDQGIHRNALLSDRLLMASTAYVGFNICILIYLTSAEHPKKIFSMGWAIRLLSEFIKYLTLLFQMFSVLQKLRMHFAKHVLC